MTAFPDYLNMRGTTHFNPTQIVTKMLPLHRRTQMLVQNQIDSNKAFLVTLEWKHREALLCFLFLRIIVEPDAKFSTEPDPEFSTRLSSN